MKLRVDEDLKLICQKILKENKTVEQWSEIESDDMFQLGQYVGGFDGTEKEFCFSIYTDCTEYWFQFSLDDAYNISIGNPIDIETRLADK